MRAAEQGRLAILSLITELTLPTTNNQRLSQGSQRPLRVLISAGEASGDLYGAQLIGHQSEMKDYGQPTVTIYTTPYLVQARADFQAIHHASVTYNFNEPTQIIVGVSNIFDTPPPAVTTVSQGLGLYNTIGVSLLNSQYNEGFLGRRGFVRLSKKF